MDPIDGAVRLQVPATAEHVSTGRLFAAAAARHFGCDEDAVEDFRLAVSEACTVALRASTSPAVLVIAVRPQLDGFGADGAGAPGGLAAHVRTERTERTEGHGRPTSPPGGRPAGGGSEHAADGSDELLRAIVSELALEPDDDGGMGVSFVLPLGHDNPATSE